MAKPPRIRYAKVALAGPDLLTHLRAKGLEVPDEAEALHALKTTGYYRLLIYMRALQDPLTKTFRSGATFPDVVTLYEFDRELRLLCLDAVERIEVALRSAIVDKVAVPYGSHFFLESRHFESIDAFCGFFSKANQAKYLAITHYRDRYEDPKVPPIWAVTEAITFGTLSHLFSGLSLTNRKAVAREFGLDESILVSWFRSVNDVRNTCAHHNRLWDKSMLVDQPKQARVLAAELETLARQRFYGRAIVLGTLLKNSTDSTWRQRLRALMARYPGVPLGRMGFPSDWEARSFWQ